MTTPGPNAELFEEGARGCPPSGHQRKRKAASKPVFKPYVQNQTVLLPQNLEELIPPKHLVRVVSATLDKMEVAPLLASYKGGGTSAYHPVMLLKVFVYGYLMKIYTGRPLARALRQDIHFMWLAGMQRPDFRTLNAFRSSQLKATIDAVFTSLITFLDQEHLIDLETYFVDGTTIEANANRHQVIWAKNTARYKARTLEKVTALLERIDTLAEEENLRYGERDLEEVGTESTLTAEKLAHHVQELKRLLQEQQQKKKTQQQQEEEQTPTAGGTLPPAPPPPPAEGACLPGKRTKARRSLEAAVRTLEGEHLVKLTRYEQQQETLGRRNSYARTDMEATVLKMKSGQLLPAYMVLVGTQEQFILHWTLHQRASESDALLGHLDGARERRRGGQVKAVVGDAAFGCEENYDVLAKQDVRAYLKYRGYDHHHRQRKPSARYGREDFVFDAAHDRYTCPQGRALAFLREQADTTRTGYRTSARLYQCASCELCPVHAQCLHGKGPRTLTVNRRLDAFRDQARERLHTEDGRALYKRRATEPESVFGDLKENQGFRRFHLRGLAKVNVEVGLLCLAHNVKKLFGQPS